MIEWQPSRPAPIVTLVLLCIASVSLILTGYYIRASKLFPPGPRGFPFIGAALSMPKEKEWLTFAQWGKKYGPLVGVRVFGQNIVIVNTPELAIEMLEGRGAIYSDRPSFTMLELMGYGEWNIGLFRYGEKLRLSRKILLQAMTPQVIPRYSSIQQNEVYRLLRSLTISPQDFSRHLRRAVGGVILMIFYGYRVKNEQDHLVMLNDEAIISSTRAGSPTAYAVNTFHALKYLPSWFPGAGFQKEAKEGRVLGEKICKLPIEMVERQMAAGTFVPCFVSSLLEQSNNPKHLAAGKAAAATTYSAAIETTTSTLTTFILAMALYPAVQRQAQAEIDKAIGRDRLPSLEQKGSVHLPFTEAVIKESYRWNPPGNLGLPHCLTQDDTICGYSLPRGTIILSNIWAILHDEERFPLPFEFLPERFLGKDGKDEVEDLKIHVFGYGRRACPGRNLAEATLWLAIVSILAVFDISPDTDDKGMKIPIVVDYTSGIMSRPKEFRCRIIPRSEAALDLIKQSEDSLETFLPL